ncbi:cytochrome P450 [Mytilinidion resinicola]|uniref:Cytochrome P450 n=1 Tax=Mytilinidion resinicola TaxID=574789 RepID=A0A6A6XZN8_9PEZI|nr:cytochrome P450 [Mytilinidion resinicola]KAF2802036.1 cytochrome P450 [Mytilinidion resinicola]
MAFLVVVFATLLAVICSIVYIIRIGYRRRSHVNELRKRGIAIAPGWSWWTGHLLVLKRHLDSMPPDASVFLVLQKLAEEHSDTETFIIDFWPAATASLIVCGSESSLEVSNKYNLPKPQSQVELFRPMIGGQSVLTMNDEDWKRWRALFNPGFSAAHMARLIPTVVESVEVFCEILREKAGGSIVQLDSLTTRLTMEVIAKVTLDMNLDNQRSEHRLSYAFNTILKWSAFWNTSILLKPVKAVVQKYYGHVLESIILSELDKRFQEMKMKDATVEKPGANRPISITAMALGDYITQERQKRMDTSTVTKLDPSFAKIASNQIRMFIMAGNDSTSATLVYAYHLLSQYPDTLLKLRQEHNEVFGLRDDAAAMLKQNPTLLNQCRYTLAVIKETLRIFPPASTQRSGHFGAFITDRQGNLCPTENLMVTIVHRAVHMNPRAWVKPDKFIPERWLVDPEDELYVKANSGAFRPFEQGPRNCIGQTLVYNELRIILVLTARSFNIVPTYDEWDAMQLEQESKLGNMMQWGRSKAAVPKTVMGERAYPTSRAGGYPADGYPCRITLEKSDE